MRALAALAAGYVRALGAVLRSLWHSLGGRGSLLFSLFLLVLVALLLLLGTEPGRVSLTRTAMVAAEKFTPDLDIRAEHIGSDHLGAWYFSHLEIDYRSETMLQARDLAVDFDIGGLLENRIDIERIEASLLRLDNDTLGELLEARGQAAGDAVEKDPEPFSPPQLRLGALQVDRLEVIDRRLPELPAVSVTSKGRYLWQGEKAELFLEIRELDGADLHITLEGRELEEGRLRLVFSAREKAGGFAGTQLQLPRGEALDASGRIALWQPRKNRLRVQVEEFSLPLVAHRFTLQGSVDIALSPWELATEALQLRVDDTRHTIAGTVSADSVDAEIRLNRLPVAISQPWQDYLTGGWLTADLSLRGPLSLPAVSGIVELESHYREQPLHLEGRVQSEEKVIRIEAATLEYMDTRLDASGRVDVGNRALDLRGEIRRLTIAEIRRLLAVLPGTGEVEIPPDLSGSVEKLQLAAKGPWDNPELTAELFANPIYRQLDAELRAKVSGNLRKLEIADLQLQSKTLSVTGSGSVDIAGESLDLQLDLGARGFRPAEELGVAAAEGVAIDLDSTLSVRGPWKNPQMAARIESGGEYKDYRYSLRGGAGGSLERIELDKLRLELFADGAGRSAPDGPISPVPKTDGGEAAPQQSRVGVLAQESENLEREGSAWLELDGVIQPKAGRARGTVAGRNIPVSLAGLAGVELPPSLSGEISIEGRMEGPFARPEATVSILALGDYRREPWQLQGDIGYGSGRVDLSDVELLWAGRNRLSASGSLNEKQLDLEVSGRARLADLDSGLPANIADRGEIALNISAAGSPQKPQLDGELRFDSRGAGQPLAAVLDWNTLGDDLHIALDARSGQRRAVEARAQLRIAPILEQLFAQRPAGQAAPPLPLDLQSGGSADLAVLAEFIDPEIHALRGRLDFTLNAGGSFDQPDLQGRIALENGDYEHRPSNTRLRRLELLAVLTPGEWRIEKARAEDGEGGSINLAGAVTFPRRLPPQMDFTLRAERMHLLNTPAVRGAVSGQLALTGTTEDSLLEGRLTLRPLSVQVEQLIGSSVPEIEVVEVEVDGPQVKKAPPLLRKLALAIEVVLDQQSYVRGLGLDSELRGKVDVAGTAAKPRASGELEIVRGEFDLLGKRFELQEGRVQFENNVAAIYVKGLHEYPEGEIIAEISGTLSGTADDLDIQFSATPDAPQDEIFAQLLFGKSMTDISPLQAIRLVGVVRTLQSGSSGFDPVARTRELLGVDTLDVETQDSDEGESQYALSLGKYITNRIYIELQRSTDPLNPWQAEMQIELRRNLLLEFKSAGESESGAGSVELQWKNDY